MTTSQPPLAATAIAVMRREVQVALDGPSGLDDAGRLDAIRALEELVCTARAAQAALAAELAESVESDHRALGLPADQRGNGAASMSPSRDASRRTAGNGTWVSRRSCNGSCRTPGPPGALAGSPSGAPR